MRAQLALVLYGAFAASGFVARTLAHRRRYRDAGWRFTRASGFGVIAHVLVVGSVLLLVVASMLAIVTGDPSRPGGLARLSEPRTLLGVACAAGGLVLCLSGGLLTVIAQRQMGASWRIGVDTSEQTALVTHGLFSRIRNPIYTGMLLFSLGQVLLVPNALAIAAVVVGAAGFQLQVRRIEEPYLLASHGSVYRRWASRAGRFLPGIGRLPSTVKPSAPPPPLKILG